MCQMGDTKKVRIAVLTLILFNFPKFNYHGKFIDDFIAISCSIKNQIVKLFEKLVKGGKNLLLLYLK